MQRNERFTSIAYLAWMVFLSCYWISLFSNGSDDHSQAMLPVGSGFVLVATTAYGLLYAHRKLASWSLIALLAHTVFFSWLAYANDASCGCYRISWIDFVPNGIAVVMTGVLWADREPRS